MRAASTNDTTRSSIGVPRIVVPDVMSYGAVVKCAH